MITDPQSTLDLDALHRNIEQRPHDLEPREVLADWLIERGDSMGEFIQLECRVLREPQSKERRKWRRRANALLKEFEWFEGLTTKLGGGMIEEAGVGREREAVFDRLLAEAPALTRLYFENWGDVGDDLAQRLARHALWRRVRDLGAIGAVPLTLAALEADNLPRLERVCVKNHRPDEQRRLFSLLGEHAPKLEALACRSTAAEALSVLSAGDLSLSELDLYCTHISPEAARKLADGGLLRGIRVLRLGDTELGPVGLDALASCSHLSTLERLELRRAARPAKGREAGDALGRLLGHAPALISAELMGNRLEAEGVSALVDKSSCTDALSELSLHGCKIGDEGLATLIASPLAPRLRVLNLRNNGLTDASASLLASTDQLPRIELLNLDANLIPNRTGAKLLRQSKGLRQATISLDGPSSSEYCQAENEKHGTWLGSTNYRVKDLIKR